MMAKKGFTLVELLVVIALIGILGVIAIATINPARLQMRARDGALNSLMTKIGYTINANYSASGVFPTKAALIQNIKNAGDSGDWGGYQVIYTYSGVGHTWSSDPSQPSYLAYSISTDGTKACLSTWKIDGGNWLRWCSNTSRITQDAGWCYADGNAGGC